MKKAYHLLVFSVIFISSSLLAQPVNDDCANAINLTLGTSCNEVGYTSIGATDDGISIAPNPSCGFYQGGDVWFTFDVPASGNFRIDLSGNEWSLYTGSCGSFTEILCDGGAVNFVRPDLAGQTLYLRAFRFNNASGSNFDLCVWEITPPSNNDCSNATALTVGTECVSQDFSTQFSTAEDVSVAENPSCGFYQGGDTWFTFDVPASGNFRVDVSSSQWTLYTGSCGSFTEFDCQSGAVNYREPSLAGQTLYLRAFRFNSDQGQDFSLCIWEFIPQPNDFCADAIELTVGSSCTLEPYSSTLSTAEDETVAPNPSCGFYQGGDTWFKFDVPASGNFRVDVSSSQWTLYTGSCGSFTEFDCQSGAVNYREPSLAGQTIYLRAFRFNNDQGQDFSLCVWEYTPQPNDFCADAIELTVGSSCTLEPYSNTLSTAEDETVAPNPSCGFYQGGDTWFKFDAPASGEFRIEVPNVEWVLYTGTCGNFTELVCESNPLNFSDPSLGGQTLYLRTFRFNNDQGSDFEICVWEIDVPANDNCANALFLPVGDACESLTYSSEFSTTEDETVAENPSCGFYQGGDVWFRFLAPESGSFTIEKTNNSANLSMLSGSCGNFTEILCSSDALIEVDEPGLGGQIITLRVYAFNSRQGNEFDLCIRADDVAPNDNCADAIPLPVGSTCDFELYHNRNATEESGLASTPSCGSYPSSDIWFTTEVPATGRLKVDFQYLGNGPYTMVLYSGTCGDFTPLGCLINPNGNIAELGNLVGETIYLRVFRNGNPIGSDFGLCLSFVDCNGDEGGTAFLDNCDTCVGGNTGLTECVPDCNGDFGGTAFIDECETCVGGNTGLEPCVQDCNGDFGGTAFIDNCGTCVGGNTGLEACLPDCNGDFGGEAFEDLCGECVGGNTGLEPCCPDPFPALNEGSLTTTVNPTNVSIGWESVLGQVGCQIQLRFAGAPSLIGSAIIGGEVDGFTIPGSVLQLNMDYEWRVRCGCSQTPLIAGPFTSWQFFSTGASIQMEASPNPTTDISFVEFSSTTDDYATVEVFDMRGVKVAELYRGEVFPDQEYRFEFNASGLPNGIYLCKYTGNDQSEVVKIMIGR